MEENGLHFCWCFCHEEKESMKRASILVKCKDSLRNFFLLSCVLDGSDPPISSANWGVESINHWLCRAINTVLYFITLEPRLVFFMEFTFGTFFFKDQCFVEMLHLESTTIVWFLAKKMDSSRSNHHHQWKGHSFQDNEKTCQRKNAWSQWDKVTEGRHWLEKSVLWLFFAKFILFHKLTTL